MAILLELYSQSYFVHFAPLSTSVLADAASQQLFLLFGLGVMTFCLMLPAVGWGEPN